jgi:hypothetical protein
MSGSRTTPSATTLSCWHRPRRRSQRPLAQQTLPSKKKDSLRGSKLELRTLRRSFIFFFVKSIFCIFSESQAFSKLVFKPITHPGNAMEMPGLACVLAKEPLKSLPNEAKQKLKEFLRLTTPSARLIQELTFERATYGYHFWVVRGASVRRWRSDCLLRKALLLKFQYDPVTGESWTRRWRTSAKPRDLHKELEEEWNRPLTPEQAQIVRRAWAGPRTDEYFDLLIRGIVSW